VARTPACISTEPTSCPPCGPVWIAVNADGARCFADSGCGWCALQRLCSAHTSGSGTGGSVVPSASSIATPSDHSGRWVDESFVAYGQSLKADVGLAIGPTGACDPILGTTMLDAVRLLDADAGPGCVCRWPSGDDDDQLG
jgi:hypothetical protein